MTQINLSLRELGASCDELHPHDVFQLVAGTSTGGLIALMLGKIGLTVEECIIKYEELSKVVFGKKHLRGRISFGLANARYSGKGLRNCVRDLLRERQLDEDLLMKHDADKMAWYVPGKVLNLVDAVTTACLFLATRTNMLTSVPQCGGLQRAQLTLPILQADKEGCPDLQPALQG